jgi:hypothetical protein
LREKGKEFDKMEAEAARVRAQERTKYDAKTYTECNMAGGTWHNPSSSCH